MSWVKYPTCMMVLLMVTFFGHSCDRANRLSLDDKMVEADTILISLPPHVSSMLIRPYVFRYGASEHLCMYDFQNHALIFFNLNEVRYHGKIKLEEHGPDFVESVGAVAYLDDRTFLLAGMNYLSRIDEEGTVIKRMVINSHNSDFEGLDFGTIELSYNQYAGLQYNTERNSVLMEVSSRSQRLKAHKFHGKRIAELYFEEGRGELLDVVIPDDYSSVEGYLGDLSRVGFLRWGDTLIYNFPMSSEVFIKIKDTRAIREEVVSAQVSAMAKPMNVADAVSSSARIDYQYTSLFYFPVARDSIRNLFYRVARRSVDSPGQKTDYFLSFIDANWNRLLEIKFPENYYVFPIVSGQGLMFPAFNKHDDKLELIRYRFR